MKKFVVHVLAEPRDERDEEFNRYYDEIHLDEVLATTGWQSAQRFKLAAQAGSECPLPYLASYEVEAESAQAVIDRLNATREQRQQSSALNKRTAGLWVYEVLTDKLTNEKQP